MCGALYRRSSYHSKETATWLYISKDEVGKKIREILYNRYDCNPKQ